MKITLTRLAALMTAFMAALSVVAATGAWAATPASEPSPVPGASAAPTAINAAALNPEGLGAQAFLEDLLVRRYSQELSTFLDRQAFTLGAQLDLAELPRKEAVPEDDTPSDLLLGTLNTDDLIKKYGENDGSAFQGFLANHQIKSVAISVGLKEDLNPTVKAEVEKWLTTRVGSEFGKAGRGSVTEIKTSKGLWAWVSRFQGLAGQLVLAFAILFGAILWKLMSSSSKNEQSGETASAHIPVAGAGAAEGEKSESAVEQTTVATEAETPAGAAATREIRQISKQLSGLVPKISKQCESLMRTWCQTGEEGRLKLACFVEAVGKDLGQLPIPVDALQDLSGVFAKMPSVGVIAKRDTLRNVYWDLLRTINLGAETLEQPFDYLGGLNIGLVNQVLIDQNPKMKALVAVHMSPSLRESYLKTQDVEAKLTLLKTTSEMSEIALEELKSFDGMFKSKLRPQTGRGSVSLDASLKKLISALSPMEEATLLSTVTGAAIEDYKRTTPSLGFLDYWSDEKLSICLSRAMPDEVVAFIRVRPALQERLIGLCPPMLAEVATDELQRPDTMNEKDKNRLLSTLLGRIKDMVAQKEIDLEEVFKAKIEIHAVPNLESQESPLESQVDDESQKAA